MKTDSRQLRLRAVLACLIIIAVSSAASAVASTERLALAKRFCTSSVEFMTALSAKQIATVASGKSIPLDDLDGTSKSQLLHAARTVLEEDWFHQALEGLASDTKLGVVVKADAILKLRNPSFGDSGEISFSIDQYVPSKVPAEVGEVGNPPSFESVLNGLPADEEERYRDLRELSRSLLEVVSTSQLDGEGIPFPIGDLPAGITLAVNGANAAQSRWLGEMYEKYRQDVNVQQSLLSEHAIATGHSAFTADGEPITVVDLKGHAANPLTTPAYTMPAWSDIAGETTVQLYAEYTLMIKVTSGCTQCGKGAGWVLKTAD